GGDGIGPWPRNGVDFSALVDWVENGIAPSQVIGASAPGVTPAITRPLCPYPQTAKYIGSGSIADAANWVCGGNLETRGTGWPEIRVKYKDEVDGPLDPSQSGVDPGFCHARQARDDDDRDNR